MPNGKIEVLLVEDDPQDVELTTELLRESKLLVNLHVVNDGEEALNYLHRRDSYADATRPDLVLLDLNLPKKKGQDVLQEIKGSEELKAIPVIILTTSDAETDVSSTYGSGANCYITKPIGFEQFTKVVQTLSDFWFTIVKLPPREQN